MYNEAMAAVFYLTGELTLYFIIKHIRKHLLYTPNV